MPRRHASALDAIEEGTAPRTTPATKATNETKATKRRSTSALDAIEEGTAPVAPRAERHIPAPKKTTRTAAPRTATAERQRASAYLTDEQFHQLRDAVVTDFQIRGDLAPNGVGEWVQDALRAHIDRSPKRRQAAVAKLGKAEGRRGVRSWSLPVDLIREVEDAITQDYALGVVGSTSSFITDAVSIAINETRKAAGGMLIQAQPGPLPRRPARRV